ncbi:MAG: adenylate/guanylate cyclase domain-containing protein [Solirubrobacteraceae bacterium]|nr:adenylate/guanylate cyclase domain-containing protein [Solirubrobacteraceae bacterium]
MSRQAQSERVEAQRHRLERLVNAVVSSPFLIGDPNEPGDRVALRVRRLTVFAILVSNAVGALVVAVFAVTALPKPEIDVGWWTVWLANLALGAFYIPFAMAVGVWWGRARVEQGPLGTAAWIGSPDPPTEAQAAQVLRAPMRLVVVQGTLWIVATALYAVLNATFAPLLGLGTGLAVALGGVTTSTAAYVLGELALRPILARALAVQGADTDRRGVPGVATRWLLSWLFGTGVPVFGLMLVGIAALTPIDIDSDTLARTIIALTTIVLVFGAFVTVLAAYQTVHPISSIRRGLARVQEGDLEAHVPVWDSTELGALQSGFNDMVDGLREREKIRDLFGRQVGEDVAEQAMATGVELGGELRDVSVLFVDIIGSTKLAARSEPTQVVALLNRFLAEVVDVVESCGGWINKFEGDAALAIWGAPVGIDDAAGRALQAAREMDERLREWVPELSAAIGVATGRAVAGHIGTERRFEYTVIGDPVNEAARLTDLAKEHTPRVLASEVAVAAASAEEAEHWNLGDSVLLRGRSVETRLAGPIVPDD